MKYNLLALNVKEFALISDTGLVKITSRISENTQWFHCNMMCV